MGDSTGISWTDATWNPVRGCSRVSEGCRHCYAELVAARFSGPGQAYEGLADRTRKGSKWTGVVRLVAEHLADPIRWKRPRRIFVNSMSDLFHESLTNEQIAAVFGVMAAAPHHTFQVLTKRATRMREWFSWMDAEENFSPNATMHVEACEHDAIGDDEDDAIAERILDAEWPLPNVWLGVSVENQAAADERIPELLRTPAAVRFLSCEPLLGEVDLRAYLSKGKYLACTKCRFASNAPTAICPNDGTRMVPDYGIDWVIAGCESGPGARPCDAAWLRSLRDQCASAGVAFFCKQAVETDDGLVNEGHDEPGGYPQVWCGPDSKRKPGGVIELPYLDGVQHAAFPERTSP